MTNIIERKICPRCGGKGKCLDHGENIGAYFLAPLTLGLSLGMLESVKCRPCNGTGIINTKITLHD